MKSIVSVGIVMFLLLPSLPVESNDNIKRNNLVNDMVERRKKSGKEMKVTMDEFWRELKETREIKYGKDIHFEKNLDYCRHFGEISVLHKGDEWNLKNIVKYCYYCMNTLNGMTREVKKEDFDIYKWTDERSVKRKKLLKEYISKGVLK
ncbi:MAG: hypothetical protein JJ837_07565 [Prochlorococcus marinus XMU1428]|jgi:hypothetical protein|nr:hypothetical protein [Prochlorococcus marinus XMU1428]